jgi:hypothetical protein
VKHHFRSCCAAVLFSFHVCESNQNQDVSQRLRKSGFEK